MDNSDLSPKWKWRKRLQSWFILGLFSSPYNTLNTFFILFVPSSTSAQPRVPTLPTYMNWGTGSFFLKPSDNRTDYISVLNVSIHYFCSFLFLPVKQTLPSFSLWLSPTITRGRQLSPSGTRGRQPSRPNLRDKGISGSYPADSHSLQETWRFIHALLHSFNVYLLNAYEALC